MKELSEQDIELIERVLSQSATENDIITFNARLDNEPEFAARVELLKNIKANIKAESGQFEAILESIHEEYEGQKVTVNPKKPPVTRYYYYVAASLVLLIAAIFVFRGFNGKTPLDRLYTNNFSIPAENITTRDNTGLDSDLIAAINAYRQKDFKKAILNFGAYLKTNPQDDAANFYIAISYLADDQHVSSIKFLEKVIDNRDSVYRSAAQWYLGLAYIKTENTDAAKSIFSELSESNSSYAKRAGVVLKRLNKE